ncbi:MAG: sigma-70 family RNA polymerase sigma factor [bacterium]
MNDDKYYIEKIKHGEKQYFSYIVKNYKKIAFTLALRMVKTRAVAEDLTQDAFVKIFINIGVFDYRVKFSTWVYKIVYNTCIDYIRTQKMRFDSIDNEHFVKEIVFEDRIDLDREFRTKALQEAILSLPGDYGFIMTLYYYDDMNIAEIAEITAQSKENVKTKLHRGRRLLEIELTKVFKNEVKSLI